MPVTTKKQQKFFAENGYLVYGRVYSEDEVERLRKALVEVQSDETQKVGIGVRAEGAKVVEFDIGVTAGKTTPSMVRMFRVHEEFRRHAMNEMIAAIAGELLNTEFVRLMEDQIIVKEPQVSGALHWHQDIVYWPLDPAVQVSCWLALDRVTVDSGAMQFVPGSHQWGEYAPVDFSTNRVINPDDSRPRIPEDPKAEGMEVSAMELEPGECGFHHSLTWHATQPNTADRPRRGLITRFMAAETRFAPERNPLHPIAQLDGLTPGGSIDRDDEFPIVWRRD